MTVEEKLTAWASQGPTARVSPAERQFIEDMRKAAAAGVGYGWMQQVIEWEWQEKYPGTAWGYEYFMNQIRELEKR
jgi:hypothetical protein